VLDTRKEINMNQIFYQLDRAHPLSHWGDYGDSLVSGDSDNADGWRQGPLQLYRTGPFIPQITFPGVGVIVVTDALKRKMERSDLKGFTFRPVIKKHIVKLEWEKWDKSAAEPQEFPESGEPEDYIHSNPHSPELANRMPDLWEIVLSEGIESKRTDDRILIKPESWTGNDLFYAQGTLRIYVTEKAKKWLESQVREWVGFSPENSVV
jgi:hypothetical protein